MKEIIRMLASAALLGRGVHRHCEIQQDSATGYTKGDLRNTDTSSVGLTFKTYSQVNIRHEARKHHKRFTLLPLTMQRKTRAVAVNVV